MTISLKPSLPQLSQRPHFMSKKAAASLMAEVASSSSDESSNVLSFRDCLAGRRVFLALVPDGGKLQSPKHLRAQIKRVLKLIKAEARLFAQRSPRWHHRRLALPPLGSVFVEYAPWHLGRVRLIFPCVATACHRLVTAPADMHMTWSWAEVVMWRVTRGRVKKVQVLLQRRACCAVRCACRASACVRCVFDACVMQETVADFEVRCCASQRLH